MSPAQKSSPGAFSADVLAEVPSKAGNGGVGGSGPVPPAGEKVELDRADLPLELLEGVAKAKEETPEPEPEPEVAVDLSAEDDDVELEEEGGKKPVNKVKLAVLGGVVLAALAGLGLGLWYGYLKNEEPPPKEEPKPYFFQGPIPDLALTLQLNLEPFIVPLLGSDEGRILRIKVSLETPDSEARRLLGEKERLLRDVIYRVLRGRPAAEIRTPQGKRLLQAQIKAEVNHALNRRLVHQVLFTEFVITG